MNLDFIVNFSPKHKANFNILLFGPSGIGKSSSINLFFSIISPTIEVKAVPRIGNTKETQTVEYRAYKLTKSITLWDTYGWSHGATYTGQEFEKMLGGSIPDGANMNNLKPLVVPKQDYEIDCVVFVLDNVSHELKEMLTSMKKYYDIAKAQGKIVVVVVTKLDESDTQIAEANNWFAAKKLLASSKVFQEIQGFLRKTWGDDQIPFFPLLNYIAGDLSGKEPLREQTGYNVLAYLLNAFEKVTHQPEKPFDYFDGETPVTGILGK